MKKGSRRKQNHKRNRAKALVVPQGIKHKKGHKNPLFLGSLDQKALRSLANQVIGSALLQALDIDFVGIMAQVDVEQDKPKLPETIQ